MGELIARAGVSGKEGPVREEVLHRLPAWAKPKVDAQGNVRVTCGKSGPGTERLLFVAHLDEVGWTVAEVLADGRLRLTQTGSLARTVWEGQAAVIHGDRGPLSGVFEPRADWGTADKRVFTGDLTVQVGFASAEAVKAAGVHEGTAVTLPKEMLRLRAVREAQEESRRMGVPNVYSLNGKVYYELPNGEITDKSPWEESASK